MTSTNAVYERPRVGGDILCHCGHCNMNLAHVVIAMVDGKPKRVICKTCRSEHNFRTGGSSSSKRSTPRSPRATKTTILASELWQQRLNENKSQEATAYDPKKKYSKGTCLNHPKFGLGCIEEVRLADKIVVLFRDGEKLLVHNLAKTDA